MSEPNNPENQQNKQETEQDDLVRELNKFGQQLETAARAALENEQAKAFQRDMMAGMKEFFGQLQSAARNVQQDERVQDLTQRGQQALGDVQEKVQDNRILRDLQSTMARGIAYLNVQLDDFTNRMTVENPDSGAKHVPIEEVEDIATPEQTSPRTSPAGSESPGETAAPDTPGTGASTPPVSPVQDAEPAPSQEVPQADPEQPPVYPAPEPSPVVPPPETGTPPDVPPAGGASTGPTIKLDDPDEEKQ